MSVCQNEIWCVGLGLKLKAQDECLLESKLKGFVCGIEIEIQDVSECLLEYKLKDCFCRIE